MTSITSEGYELIFKSLSRNSKITNLNLAVCFFHSISISIQIHNFSIDYNKYNMIFLIEMEK